MKNAFMNDQLWNLFRETGDPVGYLLYKKETGKAKKNKPRPEPREPERHPDASV